MRLTAQVIDVTESKHPDAREWANGADKGDHRALVAVNADGQEVELLAVDGGESEDQFFNAELEWTVKLLQRALDAEAERDDLAARFRVVREANPVIPYPRPLNPEDIAALRKRLDELGADMNNGLSARATFTIGGKGKKSAPIARHVEWLWSYAPSHLRDMLATVDAKDAEISELRAKLGIAVP